MYVQDFSGDPQALVEKAFQSPKLHPKKNPTLELATRVVGDLVTKTAKEAIAKEVHIDLMDAVALYEITNGEYEETIEGSQARSDYESGMDDVIEAALERWDDYLSANWLGLNTIDTQVWLSTDEDRTIVDKLADSAAKEIFTQITADKTPAQILASAGVVTAAIEDKLSTNTGDTPMTDTERTIESVVAKIKTHVGTGFDQMAVFEDVETLIEEDDEILTGSAGSRLGIDADDIDVVQLAILDMDDPASDIVAMVGAYKPPSKSATAKAKKEAKAAEKAEAAANGIDPAVFVALKECGAGDTAMAEALGVSRSTYTNYIKGKTHLNPDEDQYAYLRTEIVNRTNKMLSALSALDGTELQQVA